MKKGDKLICRKNLSYIDDRKDYFLTKNKSYELITNIYNDYDYGDVVDFIDDNNERHTWQINSIYSVFYTNDELRKRKLETL